MVNFKSNYLKVILCVLFILGLTSYVFSQNLSVGNSKVTVEIDYGLERASRKIQLNYVVDQTVLEALLTVARVETHPVNKYVFVSSIDGVKGERGKMAWYYKVNEKPADKLAYSNVVKGGDYITWIYKKDVCSEKVDK